MTAKKILGAAAIVVAVAGGTVAGAAVGVPGVSSAAGNDDPSVASPAPSDGPDASGGPSSPDPTSSDSTSSDPTSSEGTTTTTEPATDGPGASTPPGTPAAPAPADPGDGSASGQECPTGHGDGHGGDHHGGPRGPGFRPDQAAAASALGMTESDLVAELRDAKSLAAVAGEKGVGVPTLVDALVVAETAHIDAAVADGHLDPSVAAKLEAGLADRVTELVNHSGGPGQGSHPGDGGHQGGPGGHHDDGGDQAS